VGKAPLQKKLGGLPINLWLPSPPMIVTDERNESLMPEVNFDVGLNKKAEHS
jgi:hypothetical protein